MRRTQNKYHSQKVTVEGIVFDSKKEARRYRVLVDLEKAGVIKDLRRQVKYVLIPTQKDPDTTGPRGGIKRGKLHERECVYTADFVYEKDGETVVEDTKGMRTKDYIIKRKLMLWVHGIAIHEV